MQTYLFYDIETTGLNKAFDQVLHFAAIRTDLNFNEIERYEIKVKLNPDVIPSPYAMITHHMRLAEIAEGVCEYDAIKQIHQWMNTPGTISLGYNTLSFDDEFLRFSFYRNLLAPYTHQFANQCCRMDIYPITVMFYLFKNSILTWPTKNEKISLKLEELNNANQFVSGRAHHAMVDVEVTLALAKKLVEERETWNYITGNFNKKTEIDRLQKFEDDQAIMVLGKFGADRKYQSIVLSLGNHYHYNNQTLWLRLDDKDFSQATKDNILEFTFSIQKKMGEPGFLLPLKDRFLQQVSEERLALAKANKQWLTENPEIFKQITEHYRSYKYPVIPETDIDASLYLNGFWSSQEESFCFQFNKAAPQEKSKLLASVTNPKLYNLGLRILGRNFPEHLNTKQRDEFANHLKCVAARESEAGIIDFKGQKRLTPELAFQQIAELRTTYQTDTEKLSLLDELEQELKKKFLTELVSE